MRNLLILLLIYCFSFNVQAETLDFKNNVYLLVGAGMANWNLEDNNKSVARILGLSAKGVDNNAPAFKAGLGLEINENFALETYYQYLGEGKMSFGSAGILDANVDAHLYHLDLVGKLPLNQVYEDLYFIGRAGYARSQASVKVNYAGNSTDGYSNSNEVTYGAGFEFKNFRLEYQQINNMADDPRVYTLGYIFKFNQLQ